jgi:hypothetical protein
MKLNYHPDTDSLYMDLSEKPGVRSREIGLRTLTLSQLPGSVQTVAA